ncbi:MAG: PorV/PorQ family protein [Bacteroidota bacterium]
MKRTSRQSLFTLLLFGLSVLSGGEKVGTTSFQFLKLSLDARSAALGDAAVSIGNTSEALYWNPAGIRRTTGFDVSTSYLNYFLDVGIFSGAAALPVGEASSIGLFAVVVDYGTIEVTDASHLTFNPDWTYNPGLTGEIMHPTATVFGISYALSVTERLSFGLTAKYLREDLAIAKTSAVSFDGGLIYKTGWNSLNFGLSIRNFGPEVTFIKESYPVPETFAVGISAYLFAPGAAVFTETNSQSLLFSYDLSHPRDYDQQHHIGLEYGLMDVLFIRGGYKINFDEEGLTYGFGAHYGNVRFDYAYDKFGSILPGVHRFSLGCTLN